MTSLTQYPSQLTSTVSRDPQNGQWRECVRCVMDTSDPTISFDENGVCNHCRAAEERLRRELFVGEQHKERLENLIARIKRDGKGKRYDCVLGVSGGVDSSYVAYLCKKKFGLRPLAIHFDNGWNSELSVKNIENLLKKLEIDLHTFVMDWEEFRDIQLSFLRASVANSEIPTDHAINALLYREAARHGIGYIMSGGNLATESIMPKSWMHDAKDLRFLKAVHRRFGSVPMRNLPTMGALRFLYYTFIKRIRFITVLNYVTYDKEEASSVLAQELEWRRYSGKHFESIYTRFFQAYILPRKFGMDKRRPHFSSLIVSGQMDRNEALRQLQRNDYMSEQAEEDLEYVTKKFGLTREQFEEIMSQPPKSSHDYPSNLFLFERLEPLIKVVKKIATVR